jgi:glyoxylase-like metal-dependent hydrolase (beta-lactamase superfamily II)
VSEKSQQWNVGGIVVTSVVEHAVAGVPAQAFFPEADAELITAYPWLSPEYALADGTIGLAVRAFVVQSKGTTILVDPCVGNGKQRVFPMWNDASFPFLARLAAVGVDPTAVQKVVHTHLHPDHVGWDTQMVDGSWSPTFVNARYLYTQQESDYWRQPAQRQAEDVWADSVAPIFDSGRADIIAESEDLGGGLRVAPTPGHTPGHVSLWLESEGEVAVISGDVLTHPLQCAEPGLAHVADWDADVCRASRAAFLKTVEDRGALLLVNHFPGRCSGRLSSAGANHYRFEPGDALDLG